MRTIRTTSSIQFYCRKSKVGKKSNGYAPLECSIIICGQRRYVALPMKFRPEEFNKKRPSQEIIDALDMWRAKINGYQIEMLKLGIPITPSSLKTAIQNNGYSHYSVGQMFHDYQEILKKRIGVDLSEGVFYKYKKLEERVLRFIAPDEDIENITPHLVQTIAAAWRAELHPSTTAQYLTRLKTYTKYARSLGHLRIDPFVSTRISKPIQPIRALDKTQIDRLLHLQCDGRLEKILTMFIAMLATGMSYSDMQEYRASQHLKQIGDFFYIQKKRKKTGREFNAIVLPFGVPYLKVEMFPRISNQKMNKNLKAILPELNLHCHLARKSYATYLANSGSKMDINTIAAALGDDPITAMKYYTRLFPEKIIERQIELVMDSK